MYKTPETTAKRIEPPKPAATIVIEMREEVAETLLEIVRSISGNPSGRRGHADELSRALHDAGVDFLNAKRDIDLRSYGANQIAFKSEVTRG